MSVASQLSAELATLLHADERRVLLGEDVRQGGVLGLSLAAAADAALRERLIDLPLGTSSTLAHAGGLALAGLLPITLLPSASALLEGLAALRELGLVAWRSGEQRSVPALFVAPDGPGFGLGGDAAAAVGHALLRVHGVRLLALGSASEACATLRAAAQFEGFVGPTVLLLPRSFAVDDDHEQVESLGRPLGHSHRLREGDAATVFAFGEAVPAALLAADHCGHAVTVIDVGAWSPLDHDALMAAARATGKLVIAHAGGAAHGVGAELAALFAEHAIYQLDAPIVRVCGEAGPRTRADEWLAVPSAAAIAAAILRVIDP